MADRTDDTPTTRVSGAAYTSIGLQALRVTAVREGRYAKPFRPYVWGASTGFQKPMTIEGGRADVDRSA